jgi:hypothetical protein
MTKTTLALVAVALTTAVASAEPTPPPELARAAFERFRALEGRWRGTSTRGWEDESTFRTIAGGSAVLATTFDAHPGETMATLYTMNGDSLELVHYCVARNAPRLRATRIEDGGRTVHFTFVDGANLPTRDRGHMDQAVYRFRDDGKLTTRWTWYENGTARWMEEIELSRIKPAAAEKR